MRVLGIDLGLKRIGMALSDETGLAIKLLPNLLAKSRKDAIERILGLCLEFGIKAIVIGLPEHFSLQSKAIISRAEGLKHELKQVFDSQGLSIDLLLWDESYTSKKASMQLVNNGVPKNKRKKLLDAESAAILVEEYLYFSNHNMVK